MATTLCMNDNESWNSPGLAKASGEGGISSSHNRNAGVLPSASGSVDNTDPLPCFPSGFFPLLLTRLMHRPRAAR